MTRNGTPIEHHPLKYRVHSGITYGSGFEEYEACVAAGLDLERWEAGQYEPGLKARVVAWYRLHGLIEAHSQDAQASTNERQARHRKAKQRKR